MNQILESIATIMLCDKSEIQSLNVNRKTFERGRAIYSFKLLTDNTVDFNSVSFSHIKEDYQNVSY